MTEPARLPARAPAPSLRLVSHALCPYAQRVAIALAEKGVAYDRIDIDLAAKPDWFLAMSPLGKVPVLQVDGAALFESAPILEYLEDTAGPPLHPADPLERARHRAWIEVASQILNGVAGFYGAPDARALAAAAESLAARFRTVEAALGAGPFFAGPAFGLVDAAFAPVFRYFDTFDRIGSFGVLDGSPKLAAWRAALAARPSVANAVSDRYPDLLRAFIRRRGGALAARLG